MQGVPFATVVADHTALDAFTCADNSLDRRNNVAWWAFWISLVLGIITIIIEVFCSEPVALKDDQERDQSEEDSH
jgi:uncharacterized membrane protein